MAAGRLKIDIRRNKILELLAQNGQVTVAELSELLNATQTTIRTDLDTMAAENRLMRIPGGAIAVPAQPVQPPVQEAAPDALAAQKRAIAAKTLSHIQNGDTLFLNSGSTTLRVAEALCARKRLCVVTNSIRAAEVLAGYPETHVVLLGGEINAIYGFTFGDDAVQQLGRYQPAWAILSVDGVNAAQGITTCTVPQHFGGSTAAHLLGYLDSEGRGVSGLEKAYDDLLTASGDARTVTCFMTAQGRLLTDTSPLVAVETPGTGQGVRLTLDADLQRACEGLATLYLPRGCLVVMDTATGEVLASVSMPSFDPQNVAASIAANDTSLLNRPLRAFSAGSVFKVVLAAAAYESGLDWYTHDCTGEVEVAGQTYRCALGRAHGVVNLRGALEQSCNCYFIALGQLLGGQAILNAAQSFGLGTPALLAPGLKSAAGELPSAADLQNAGSLASLSFGQGGLTVTPLQVTAMFNAIASGGVYHSPCIVSSITGGTQVPQQPQPAAACSPAVARVLQSMLATVVRSGIGGDAQPHTGTAAGKTGTAQTGQFDADGRELLHYWFAGFYPADAPRYTITVLQDSQQKPQTSSAALFAQVADALAVLDAAITEKPAENS